MMGSVYIGLSGLITFSKGLDSISNNVANMNTPGHKRSDLVFRDLLYQNSTASGNDTGAKSGQIGSGVTGELTTTNYSQGEIKETGNATDVAIDGNGFFILEQNGNTYYTRAGQFDFAQDGFLVASGTEARVKGIENGQLIDISINAIRSLDPSPTTRIQFKQNLSTDVTNHEISGVKVYDSEGQELKLNISFTNNNEVTPNSWLVDVSDSDNNDLLSGGEIRFKENGTPEVDFNQLLVKLNSDDESSAITLDFGDSGTLTGATALPGGETSSLIVNTVDGRDAGSLISTSFDQDGVLNATYSSGDIVSAARLALAWFDDLQSLVQLGDARFEIPKDRDVVIGPANTGVMGKIVPNSIELSNVDLTLEFTDLIIMQRGFQGASQIITVSNEMLQQLLNMDNGSG